MFFIDIIKVSYINLRTAARNLEIFIIYVKSSICQRNKFLSEGIKAKVDSETMSSYSCVQTLLTNW